MGAALRAALVPAFFGGGVAHSSEATMCASTCARTMLPAGARSSRLFPASNPSTTRRASGERLLRGSEPNPLFLFAPDLDAAALLADQHAPALLDLLHALRGMAEAAAAAR